MKKFQPRDIIHGALDEVLRVLKSDSIRDKDKRKEVEALIKRLSDERYALLVNLSKKITDFVVEDEDVGEEDIDENVGVRVQFDDDDDECRAEFDYEIREAGDDLEDDQDGVEAVHQETLRRIDGTDDDETKTSKADALHPRHIHAQWILRQISQYYADEVESQQAEQKIIDILETAINVHDCENKLVDVLDSFAQENFAIVKKLLDNRAMVLYCTKLAKAEPHARTAIEVEMKQTPELASILNQLRDVDANDDDGGGSMERRKQRVAVVKRDVEGEAAVAAAYNMAEPKIVKFDELAFAQGSHYNSSSRCVLPSGTTKTNKKSYESVVIPAQKPKPFAANEVCCHFAASFFDKPLICSNSCQSASCPNGPKQPSQDTIR